MTKQRRFAKEFEEEAVRLAGTSGRTQREIAEDLGVALSTLVRWIRRSRDRLMDTPDQAPQADMAAELKRLRRERDILKRATASFAREGIDEVPAHRGTVRNFVREAGYRHQMTKRSPKMTANWLLASPHSRGGRFHSSAA